MKHPVHTLIAGLLLVAAAPAALPAQTSQQKARAIEGKLIAPCCWTQPVSQHSSEVSNRMKREIGEMVSAGRTEQEILEHFVAEFGERVLASPRPRGFNRAAYILPWVAPVAGGLLLWVALRRLRRGPVPAVDAGEPPDPRYRERLEKELRELE